MPNVAERVAPGPPLGSFALAGGELFEDGPRDLLQFAETRQVFLKIVIEQLRVLRTKLIAQDHVPQLHRVRQERVFLKLFESLARIVVIHTAFPPEACATRRLPTRFLIVRNIER